MPPIEECDFIEELGIEAYNKIKEVRDQIQKEYPLKLSVHEDDLKDLKCYRGHKYEGKPFTDYVYYGCIDTQEYENTGVTIFHGPGCFLLSTGLLREGIFQGGQLWGEGRTIYPNLGWYQGIFKKNQYHGLGMVKRGYNLRKKPVTKNFYLEKGTFTDEERQGLFEFIDTDKNIYRLEFEK